MFKFEFTEATAVLLVLAAGSIFTALLGVNFLDSAKPLLPWIRVAFFFLGVAFFIAFVAFSRRSKADSSALGTTTGAPKQPDITPASLTPNIGGLSNASSHTETPLRDSRNDLERLQEEGGAFEVIIPCAYPERSKYFIERSELLMNSAGFSNDVISRFRAALNEAVTNAFEHGCVEEWRSVALRLEAQSKYFSFEVVNVGGRAFHLKQELKGATQRLLENPSSRRGRGLLAIYDLSDHLTSVENGRGIRCVFHRDEVLWSVTHIEDVTVATLVEGLYNPSFKRRSAALVTAESGRDVILDFSSWTVYPPTVGETLTIDVQSILSKAQRRVVALLNPAGYRRSPISLQNHELIAYDVPTALAKLGHPKLKSQVTRVIEEARYSR